MIQIWLIAFIASPSGKLLIIQFMLDRQSS